ncbi:5752_t:CDS:2, partial [Funneliformis mosseae]
LQIVKEFIKLSEKIFEILEKQEINDRNFLKIVKEKLEKWSIPNGLVTKFVDFAKELEPVKIDDDDEELNISEGISEYDMKLR